MPYSIECCGQHIWINWPRISKATCESNIRLNPMCHIIRKPLMAIWSLTKAQTPPEFKGDIEASVGAATVYCTEHRCVVEGTFNNPWCPKRPDELDERGKAELELIN